MSLPTIESADTALPKITIQYRSNDGRYQVYQEAAYTNMDKADVLQYLHELGYSNMPEKGVRYTPAERILAQIRIRSVK